MYPFRYRITLRLTHPDINPDLITSAMGEEPFRKWQAGHQRMTPKGQLLDGVYKHTYWCGQGVSGEGFDLAESLESELVKLEQKKTFLADLRSTGGSVEFYIAWFTGEKNTGAGFGWELLKRLSSLQVNLSFDVYGGRDPGEKGRGGGSNGSRQPGNYMPSSPG